MYTQVRHSCTSAGHVWKTREPQVRNTTGNVFASCNEFMIVATKCYWEFGFLFIFCYTLIYLCTHRLLMLLVCTLLHDATETDLHFTSGAYIKLEIFIPSFKTRSSPPKM